VSTAEDPGFRRAPPLGLGPPSCLGRLSSPLRAGLPSRAAPGLGFPPARIPPFPWVVSPLRGPALGSLSVTVLVGRVPPHCRGRRPLSWSASPGAGFCPGRGGTCGPECELIPLTETPGGAGGEAARPANGSSWGKKAQLSLLNNLDP